MNKTVNQNLQHFPS